MKEFLAKNAWPGGDYDANKCKGVINSGNLRAPSVATFTRNTCNLGEIWGEK